MPFLPFMPLCESPLNAIMRSGFPPKSAKECLPQQRSSLMNIIGHEICKKRRWCYRWCSIMSMPQHSYLTLKLPRHAAGRVTKWKALVFGENMTNARRCQIEILCMKFQSFPLIPIFLLCYANMMHFPDIVHTLFPNLSISISKKISIASRVSECSQEKHN